MARKAKSLPLNTTVDDFGYSNAVNDLIIQAIEQGALTDISTMVSMPGSTEALTFIEQYQGKRTMKFGLHLNLTEGKPLLDTPAVRSLVDEQGYFIGWPKLIGRLIFHRVSMKEVQQEIDAQIAEFSKHRQAISFINSHHHIHLWPSLVKHVRTSAKKHNVAIVRAPSSVWLPSVTLAHAPKALIIQTLGVIASWRYGASTKYFIDLDWSNNSDKALKRLVDYMPSQCELSCHPHIEEPGTDHAQSVRNSTLAWLLKQVK